MLSLYILAVAREALPSLIRHHGAAVGHALGQVKQWAPQRGGESCVGPCMGVGGGGSWGLCMEVGGVVGHTCRVGGMVGHARGWGELCWAAHGDGRSCGLCVGVGGYGLCVGVGEAVLGCTWGGGGIVSRAWGWLAAECGNAQSLSLAGVDHESSPLIFSFVFLR